MGIMSKLLKASIAKKAFKELSKKENQRKIKGLFSKASKKRSSR